MALFAALVVGAHAVGSAQALKVECLGVAQPAGAPAPLPRPALAPDSALLALLYPYEPYHAWPSRTALDSAQHSREVAFFATLAWLVTDPDYAYGQAATARAAEEFRNRNGSPTLILWALGNGLHDESWTRVLSALPKRLSESDELLLLRQACGIAVQLQAMDAILPTLRALRTQSGPPGWYFSARDQLRLIQARLTAQRAADFEKAIGPLLVRADSVRTNWEWFK